jgi:hypothetical protein
MGGVSAAPDREGLELVNDRSAPLRDPSDRRVDGGHVTRGDVLTAANSACNKRAQRLLDGNRRIAVRTGLPPTGIVPEPSPCAYPSASSTGRSFPLANPPQCEDLAAVRRAHPATNRDLFASTPLAPDAAGRSPWR